MLKKMGIQTTLIALACTTSLTAFAYADTARYLDLPSGDLLTALEALSKQSGAELIYQAPQLKGLKTHGITGTLTSQQAVTELLKDTPLVVKADATGAMLITLPRAPAVTVRPAEEPGGKTRSSTPPPTSSTPSERLVVEEVVVSAQKRGDERLQDVPIPVSALDAEKLADTGRVMLRDYAAHIPGFRAAPDPFGGGQLLAIRGVTTGTGNPTVGVTVDDVPYGGSAGRLGGLQVPDFDPGDLSRVEVLRGPQGTLYGAASMGGLLKFVTRDPSTAGYSGRIEAGLSSVHNGDGAGYNVRGAANVPLGDTLALRASAFKRRDAGYIENPVFGTEGLNETNTEGGRVSLLWRPSDNLSLKLSALYQHAEGGVSTVYVLPGLGELQRNGIVSDGEFSKLNRAFSAVLNARFGNVSFTSLTGYSDLRTSDALDYGFTVAPSRTQAQFGVSGSALHSYLTNDRFVQELRLSAPIGEKFDWLLGAFYDDENGPYDQRVLAHDASTGAIAGEWAHYVNPGELREYAAFANLTYHVTDRFDIQVGGRKSYSRFDMGDVTQTGPLTGQVNPIIVPGRVAKTNAFTYLLTPQFKFSPDMMVYARFASGYRPGGPNRGLPNMPAAYATDKTQNYEAGFKGAFLDRALTVDASVYYIDWKDIQIQLANAGGFSYLTNGSRAKSQGVEVALEARPASGLTVSGWVAYNNAELSEAFPAGSTAFGLSGDPLPFASDWSGSLSVRQDFPLSGTANAFVEGVWTYVGERTGLFTRTAVRQIYPSYSETDLRTGLMYDSWTVTLYANNLTDRRALVGGGVGLFPSYSYFYVQPRTVGLTVSKTFE